VANNNYAKDASLEPKDAIAQDDPNKPEAQPYVNIWAARAADNDNPVLNKVIELASGTEWEAGIQESAANSAVVVTLSKAALLASLNDVQAQQLEYGQKG
jgi:D-methionine transport system substrate-binding protein